MEPLRGSRNPGAGIRNETGFGFGSVGWSFKSHSGSSIKIILRRRPRDSLQSARRLTLRIAASLGPSASAPGRQLQKQPPLGAYSPSSSVALAVDA